MCDPPPVLAGYVYRSVTPSFIADYEGISDTTWTAGTTGNTTENFNCYYAEINTSSRRDASVAVIMAPVRFTVYSPASDGGTFDYWIRKGGISATTVYDFIYGGGVDPITTGMIPSGSHCEFVDDEAYVGGPVGTTLFSTSLFPYPVYATTADATFSSGLNIDPGYMTREPYAFAHRVNGSIVGSVVMTIAAANVKCIVTASDTYEIDVWYRIAFTSNTALPATPGKAVAYFHTTHVSTGSRRKRFGANSHYNIVFANVNFAPAFNMLTQTYELTVAGHTGWYLIAGSNGPAAMMDRYGYWHGGADNGFAYIQNTRGTIYDGQWSKITLTWNSEIAYATVEMRSTSSVVSNRVYYYRSTTASTEYRTRTTSTDYGSIDSSFYGFFNQSGTTTFEYIEDIALNPAGATVIGDGNSTTAAVTVTRPADVPTSLTFTRIARPTTGSTTYDSGSGDFIVPPLKTILTMEGWGGGGGGGGGGSGGAFQGASGGAQGGYFIKTISVSPGDVITWSVGTAGVGGAIDNDGTAGGATTISGGTYTANGGAKGVSASALATAGGTATGGDTNTTGLSGAGRGASAEGGNGGGGALGGSAEGIAGADAVAPANGGGGGAKNAAGGNGANGRVKFSY